jgi:phenylacetate-CoA ligase
MVKKLSAKHFGFPLQDRIMKTNILKTKAFLLKSQHWNSNEIEQYQLNKLKILIEHCYKNIPYYTELFKANNLTPENFNSINDLKLIPVLTKDIFRENQHLFISKGETFKNVKKGKTGGTTGTAVRIYKDTKERTFAWASYYRWFSWMGLEKEDRVLIFWGTSKVVEDSFLAKLKNNIKNILQNNLTLSAFNINDNTLPDIYEKYMKFDPLLIKGYLSSIIDLACFMKSNNLKPNGSLKAISTTTETLLPIHRELIEEVFKVKVFDQYGCGEVSGIAYECELHNGLHITEEHVIIEILNEKNSSVVDKSGKITITSLDNFVMPLIRYQNDDIATLSSNKCNCGKQGGILKSIEGRSIDTIKLKNGSKVHGVFFTNLFYEIGIDSQIISKFQIEQIQNGSIDIRLELLNEISVSIIKNLKIELEKFVSVNKIEAVKKIKPENNGKFRYIKSFNYKEN